ncbi:MAG: sigma-70 family RNA polymerase sigma factor [Alphaproteobacteria bacterium]|jgi:RNA polymerase sigma-70 factor (ECF subfamily)|nr:sigma-70 family RNA polymerase sigma factor [Alphaproteobacteria bacterium]
MADLEHLIVAEIPSLRRYARALTGDAASADDLVQDCLERALRRRHLWLKRGSMRAWLFAILHNQHRNAVRAQSRRPRLVPTEESLQASVLPAQDHAVRLHQFSQALRQLPEEQRAVVLLVGLEGMTYRETANILGVPIGTVMSRLARGRERLRQMNQGPEHESKFEAR